MVLKDFAKVLALTIFFFLLLTFYKGEAPEPSTPELPAPTIQAPEPQEDSLSQE